MTSKAKSNADIAIQIDPDGTQAGIFNAAGDPNLSFVRSWTTTDDGEPKREPDEWLLTFPGANGSQSFHTGVLDKNDSGSAEAKARAHLRDISFTPQAIKIAEFGNEPEHTGW